MVPPPLGEARAWPGDALGPEAYARRVAACRPDAPVRVGVVVNPRARVVRAGGQALAASVVAAAGSGLVRETRDVEALRATLAGLLGSEGVNVLAVLGGDGTVHTVINELLALTHTVGEERGAPPPLPRLLVLQGGTLNIVGRTLGTLGPPARSLARFCAAYGGAPLARVPSRPLPLLRVESAAFGRRFGFVFGSEMVRHVLELYDEFGGGHGGLSKLLFEGFRGYALQSAFWRRERWRLDPPGSPLVVAHAGGQAELGRYAAAVASTVDLAIAGGALRALGRPEGAGAFSLRVITETRAVALVKMAPGLMIGRPLGGTLDVGAATAMRLEGSFTLDGEVFPRVAMGEGALSVEIAAPLDAVTQPSGGP
jgi:Diacylglycerol kinase catalytic domain